MSLRSFVVAASLIPVAARPLVNRLPAPVLRLFASRRLPFSTGCHPPESPTPFACGSSDRVPHLYGLPFDSMEVDHERRAMTLWRRTKDEIIQVLVEEGCYYDESGNTDGPCLRMHVQILYGNNSEKIMEFDIKTLPGDPGQIVIERVKISPVEYEGESEVHVDEFEGFLERRGFNRSNLDFMMKYVDERRAKMKCEI